MNWPPRYPGCDQKQAACAESILINRKPPVGLMAIGESGGRRADCLECNADTVNAPFLSFHRDLKPRPESGWIETLAGLRRSPLDGTALRIRRASEMRVKRTKKYSFQKTSALIVAIHPHGPADCGHPPPKGAGHGLIAFRNPRCVSLGL